MYKLNEIQSRCEKENIKLFKVAFSSETIKKSVLFDSVDEFFSFAKLVNASCLYVMESYIELQNYMITEEVIDKVLGEYKKKLVLDSISAQIDEYNAQISELNISDPSLIIIVCIHEGIMFSIFLENEVTLNGELLLEPDDKLYEMIENHEEQIKKLEDTRKKQILKQKEMLRKFILSDDDFYLSTNNRIRRMYTQKVFAEKMNQNYVELKEYWSTPYDMPTMGMYDFVEALWKECGKTKNSKK